MIDVKMRPFICNRSSAIITMQFVIYICFVYNMYSLRSLCLCHGHVEHVTSMLIHVDVIKKNPATTVFPNSLSKLDVNIRLESMVVYCVVTEVNLGIMLCRHDTYPSRHSAGCCLYPDGLEFYRIVCVIILPHF